MPMNDSRKISGKVLGSHNFIETGAGLKELQARLSRDI